MNKDISFERSERNLATQIYQCHNDDCKAKMKVCECLRTAMYRYKIKQKEKEHFDKWADEVTTFYDDALTLLGFGTDTIMKTNKTYLEVGRITHEIILNKIRKFVEEE